MHTDDFWNLVMGLIVWSYCLLVMFILNNYFGVQKRENKIGDDPYLKCCKVQSKRKQLKLVKEKEHE